VTIIPSKKATNPQPTRRLSWLCWAVLSAVMLAAGLVLAPEQIDTRRWSRQDIWGIDRALIRRTLSPEINQNGYPKKIVIYRDGTGYQAMVEYTIDPDLQQAVTEVFEKYSPDYGVFVALDPETGEILALVNHQRRGISDQNLALRATYPAASVFKIITAAAVLDLGKATPATVMPFNGKTTSLYRKNVLKHKDNQWTRRYPLSSAFGKSVNTVFARLGIFSVGGETLVDYAEAFGFNQGLGADFALAPSQLELDGNDPWSIAEIASGYTRSTTLSPVHGAVIAAVAINGGRLVTPSLVRKVVDDDGLILYASETARTRPVVSHDAARNLQVLMRQTVSKGSASGSFKKFGRNGLRSVDVGGKTGSLTGENPGGRYDWFVGYAQKDGRKLAFAAMCINEEFWYVKSAYVARKAIEHFFRRQGKD
jgi:cell division protein FtsI/penicillin-binding protein 2|tara:strand:+ start:15087 stop:16358 length:1272 start_codon:yes stop_codon:yes gene_type:complete